MHELSIAEALRDLTLRKAPPGAVVSAVRIRIGPMRGVEPEALQWAWQATTSAGTVPISARGNGDCPVSYATLQGSRLELDMLPWTLQCPQCKRRWEAPDLWQPCTCGCDQPHPVGGDELTLVSLDVQDSASLTTDR
jgi:Zn finger protein HypA/HybF involved in hydrogenase expression